MKRREAFRQRWRRPWDGEDGKDYLAWQQTNKKYPSNVKIEWDNVLRKVNEMEKRKDYENYDDEDDDEEEEYANPTWEDTEFMDRLRNHYVNVYLASHRKKSTITIITEGIQALTRAGVAELKHQMKKLAARSAKRYEQFKR